MLRFFGTLIGSVKQVSAEAKAEQAKEKLAAEAAQATKIAALKKRLAEASRLERFAVALAAPYRQTFSSELRDAREEDRPPVYMMCVDLADHEIRSWKKLLDRDFGVADRWSAETVFSEFAKLGDDIRGPDACALWTARYCHLVSASAAVGYIDQSRVLTRLAPAAERAVETFAGWQAYSERFLTGERNAPGSNVLGRKALQYAVKALLSNEYSPWNLMSWPETRADIASHRREGTSGVSADVPDRRREA